MLNIVVRRTTGILAPHDWVALTDDYEPGDALYQEAYGDDPQDALDSLGLSYAEINKITIEHS